MTAIMNSDTRGIMDKMYVAGSAGFARPLASYISEVMRHDNEEGAKILGGQLAQLQGAGTGTSPIEFFEEQVLSTSGKIDNFKNAKIMGYYIGAVHAGIGKLNADFSKTVNFTNDIVGAAAAPFKVGGAVIGFAGSLGYEILNKTNGERIEIVEALHKAAIPLDAEGHPYDGPAADAFKNASSYIQINNNK